MMETYERRRHDLYTKLAEVLGPDDAETLMEYLPPWSWPEIATKDDLQALARELRTEMSSLRHELRGEMAELRGEMSGLRHEVHGELAKLRGEIGEVRGEIGEVRGEIGASEGRLHEQIAKQTRMYIFATMSAVITTGGIAFGAAGLA